MRLDPLPPEALAHLDPLRREIYDLTERAIRELAQEQSRAGEVIRSLRPDLAAEAAATHPLLPDSVDRGPLGPSAHGDQASARPGAGEAGAHSHPKEEK